MMDMMNFGHGAWMMGGMWPLSTLFLALIVVGVLLFVRWLSKRDGQGKKNSDESPLDILKNRYAKGEIDRETFEKIRRDIDATDRER
ncbi:MAG: SHOCT domain-containing protein [Telluria sp.]